MVEQLTVNQKTRVRSPMSPQQPFKEYEMRKLKSIDNLIVHCSATYADMDIGVKEIRSWHVDDNGWDDIGYHIVIRRSGEIEYGRSMEYQGAHARGYNHNSIGVCLVGGLAKNPVDGDPVANFSFLQYKALLSVVDDFPGVDVIGHCDVSAKSCPCFSVQALLGER